MQKQGIVKAISKFGIMIDNEWYNSQTETEAWKTLKGKSVEIEYSEKNNRKYFTSFKVLQSTATTPNRDSNNGARIGMAMNIAAQRVNAMIERISYPKPLTEVEYAVMVVGHAIQLLKEMERKGL